MFGSLTLMLAGWALSYWWWGVPRLWTDQPDEWEALVAQIARRGPEDWEPCERHYSGRLNYRHRILDIKLEWDGARFPYERYMIVSSIPLSRAGRLALLRSGRRAVKHYAEVRDQEKRLETAKRIIQRERPPC